MAATKKNFEPSIRTRKAAKLLLENGGNKSKAMREAGFSASYSKNPHKLTKSRAFQEVLEEAGLTDDFLARQHQAAFRATEVKEMIFRDIVISKVVDMDENHPKFREGKINKETITEYVPVSKKEIENVIRKIAGASLVNIARRNGESIVTYQVPLYSEQGKALERAYKVKGHFAPEKHEHDFKHEMTDAEKLLLEKIKNKNKKNK